MKALKSVFPKALMIFLLFTVICGVAYTGIVTGVAQLIFPDKANGSLIEVDGKKYGCELLGQQYTDEEHMWGRIMNVDISTYKDENGKTLMYAAPSNISPASEEYAQLVAERVEKLRAATRIWMKQLFRWILLLVPAVGLIPIFPRRSGVSGSTYCKSE